MTRRTLFVIQTLPYANARANETLDLLLVAAAFDMAPSVLFIGDGVYQLVPAEHPESLDGRDVARAYQALPAYDVEQIFIDRASLLEASLENAPLTLSPKWLERSEVRALIAAHDLVFVG